MITTEETVIETTSLEETLAETFWPVLIRARKDAYVVWGTQVTIDYKIKVDEKELAEIARYYSNKHGISENDKKILETIALNGMGKDVELPKFQGDMLKSEIEAILKKKCELNLLNSKECKEEIGGSPAISAIASYFLQDKNPGKAVAKTKYFGTYPKSVEEYVQKEINKSGEKNNAENLEKWQKIDELLSNGVKNEKFPATLSFECGKYKLMLANSEGRDLKDLEGKLNFPETDRPLVAIGGLNKGKPDEYLSLIEKIREKNAYVFVGTNSFEGKMRARDIETMEGYVKILREADIVSMNEAELDQIHEALYGKREISRAQKLEQLGINGLAAVHSSGGVIFHMGVSIKKESKNSIEGILKLSVDATSYYFEKGEQFSKFEEIRDYREDLRRNKIDYLTIFGNNHNILNAGDAVAPFVNHEIAKGSITGLGAMFDGYICALIAPVFHFFKKREKK